MEMMLIDISSEDPQRIKISSLLTHYFSAEPRIQEGIVSAKADLDFSVLLSFLSTSCLLSSSPHSQPFLFFHKSCANDVEMLHSFVLDLTVDIRTFLLHTRY